jgi:predicted DNA-binding protein (UPF0251 family)
MMYSSNPYIWNRFFFSFVQQYLHTALRVKFRQSLRQHGCNRGKFLQTLHSEEKKVAIALWKAKVPLKTIREQCQMSESTLWKILSHAKENPHTPVLARKKGNGQTPKINPRHPASTK